MESTERASASGSSTIQPDKDNQPIKLPSFSSLFASIQPAKPQPSPANHRSDWNALTEAASAEYSHSAPSNSPWLSKHPAQPHQPDSQPSPTPPQIIHHSHPIRLPPIHLVSPSGGYLHPLPSGLVGGPASRDSRGQRSPPLSHRKRSNSLTGHPYAYAPSSRSTYEPPPVVTDLGRRPSLGNFGAGPPQQPSQVGPSGLSRRARIQSRSPPREYLSSVQRGRPSSPSPSQPRTVDYGAHPSGRGRAGSQSEDQRPVMAWDRDGPSQRSGGSPSYSSSTSSAAGPAYAEHYTRNDPGSGSAGYYPSRSNNVASDLSALHISQTEPWRPHSSHAPLPPMNTGPAYSHPHPPRSQPQPQSQAQTHMAPPQPRGPPGPDPDPQRNGLSWSNQAPPSRGAYQAGEANPHAVPVGASAPPEVGRYACPHCPKRFARPSSLRIHIHSHTGEKPFACQHCHRGFSVQSNLRRHLKIHRSNGVVTAEESEGGGSMSDEDGSEETMDVVG